MSGKRYPEDFKIEAVKQVVDRGHSASSVATLRHAEADNIFLGKLPWRITLAYVELTAQ